MPLDIGLTMLVRKGGLEPPRPKALPPQDSVSTSFTTSARCVSGRPYQRPPQFPEAATSSGTTGVSSATEKGTGIEDSGSPPSSSKRSIAVVGSSLRSILMTLCSIQLARKAVASIDVVLLRKVAAVRPPSTEDELRPPPREEARPAPLPDWRSTARISRAAIRTWSTVRNISIV